MTPTVGPFPPPLRPTWFSRGFSQESDKVQASGTETACSSSKPDSSAGAVRAQGPAPVVLMRWMPRMQDDTKMDDKV